MKLVTGGAFQGKLAYAKEHYGVTDGWIDGRSCADSDLETCRGIDHFHEYVRRFVKGEPSADEAAWRFADWLYRKNPDVIVVTNELGYGVVPMDRKDREYRETAGRIGTCLAAKAEEVVRVVCGIGTVIKQKKITSIIFDIDETLYDYEAGNRLGMDALGRYCRLHFGTEQETFQQVYRTANRLAAERIGSVCAAIHNRLIRFQIILELLGQPLFPHATAMAHAYWDTLIDAMTPREGILEWMHRLKESGLRIGIGTNMTAYVQYKKLEKLGMTSYIDWMVTSEEAGCEKPEARFFELCLEKSKAAPSECLFVGDGLNSDILGALSCGMHALLYQPGAEKSGVRREERTAREYAVIRSYTECLEEGFLEQFH